MIIKKKSLFMICKFHFIYSIFLFFSFNVLAYNISSLERYKENFTLLVNDISKLEEVDHLDNTNLLNKEMLSRMYLLRNNFDHLSNPLKLDFFFNDASFAGWEEVAGLKNNLIKQCESNTTQGYATCKEGLFKIKKIILNSNLLADKKESIDLFIDNYILQVNAFGIINIDFINNFNKNSIALNLNKKNIQNTFSNTLETDEEKPEYKNIKTSSSSIVGQLFFVFISLLLLLVSIIYYFKVKNVKRMKAIYFNIFTVAKANSLELKIFGQLGHKEVKIIEKVQLDLLSIVKQSRAISEKSHIKFKKNEGSVLVEVNYFTSRAIQNIISMPKEKSLNTNIIQLQEIVNKNGGEFTFMNKFNSFGDLVESGFSFSLP